MAAEYMQAKTTYHTMLDGSPVTVHRGENVRIGHPLIDANPDKFEPLAVSSRWETVEQATAGPGEKRTTGRRGHRPVGATGMPRDPRGISDEKKEALDG